MMRRFRFRTNSLLWLMVVVAAFFVGRRSAEIATGFNRWWQVTRVSFGGDVARNAQVVMWPQRSATINENYAVQNISIDDPQVCRATQISDRQLRISPRADGETTVRYSLTDLQKPCRFEVVVENGRIADWTLSGPARGLAGRK